MLEGLDLSCEQFLHGRAHGGPLGGIRHVHEARADELRRGVAGDRAQLLVDARDLAVESDQRLADRRSVKRRPEPLLGLLEVLDGADALGGLQRHAAGRVDLAAPVMEGELDRVVGQPAPLGVI